MCFYSHKPTLYLHTKKEKRRLSSYAVLAHHKPHPYYEKARTMQFSQYGCLLLFYSEVVIQTALSKYSNMYRYRAMPKTLQMYKIFIYLT